MGEARRLRVRVSDERGRAVADRGLASWLQRIAPKSARGLVSVALVSDARIRALNFRYRGRDYPTDVLSFPAQFDLVPAAPLLGDIVIARGVAARQARQAGHAANVELRVLALHGLLHLLGYDHERDDGRMRRVERRLRVKGGLEAGLIERARGSRPMRSAT